MISHISVRKLLHDYAIPIFATIVFIVIVTALWITHQFALASVKDLANTNPLIVSDKSRLVSSDQSTDPVIEQFFDSGTTTQGQSNSSGGSTAGTTGSQNQSSSGQGSAGQSKPSSGAGGGSSGSQSSAPRPPFTASLGNIEDRTTRVSTTVTLLGIVLGCTVDHQFKITVSGQNGPGTVKYRWVRSTGSEATNEQAAFPAGSSSVELTHTMTTSTWGDYSVTLEVTAPSVMEKKYSFSHQC